MMRVGLLCGREYSFPPAFIAKVTELGAEHGIVGELVRLGGTYMGEAPRYRVIVDRISHEVDYYRGYLKHAVLGGAYVINNPFWWSADDKFFNYAVAARLGVAIPRTILLPQKGYPWDVDIQTESLRNLEYPLDWDAMLEFVGLPAILKPFSGGGWKHVYKVSSKEELWAAYDGTAPYCMTLQEFIDFDQQCAASPSARPTSCPSPTIRTSGATRGPRDYLSKEVGERVVREQRSTRRSATR